MFVKPIALIDPFKEKELTIVLMCISLCGQGFLNKLQEEIGKTLEKVSSREKYINNQLEHLIQEYRYAQSKLNEVKHPVSNHLSHHHTIHTIPRTTRSLLVGL